MRLTITLLFILLFNQSFCQPFTPIAMPAGYSNLQLRIRNGVALDQSNNLWVAFDKIGLGKFDGSSWTMYDTINMQLPSAKATGVTVDNTNRIIVSTGKGISIYNGTWQHFDNSNSPLPLTGATTVSVSGSTIWAGSNSGIYKYDGVNWTSYNASSGLINDSVTCIAAASSNDVWVGTRYGVSKFYSNTWNNYSTANTSLTNDNIRSIAINSNGNAWITNAPSECYYFNGSNFMNLSTLLPAPQSGCLSLNPTAQSGVINVNGDIHVIIDDPNPAIAPTQLGNISVKADAANKVFCAPVQIPFVSTTYPLQIAYANGNFATLSSWSATTNIISFYKGNVNPSSFKKLDSDFIGHDFLDINKVSALMLNKGDMHWDPVAQQNYYMVPSCSGKESVYSSGLWIGGLDANNQIVTAAQTYRQSGNDFWTGPLNITTAATDTPVVESFDRLWKLNRTTLNDFIYNYQQGNVTNGTYDIPEVIANWPAHGPAGYSNNLAPFFDNNGDGNYNPYDGDYPEMTGDQQLWWIFNDAVDHVNTQSLERFGFEIHAKAYAYNCNVLTSINEPINYTTFYQYKIINRSNETYHDMYLGLWVDNDLGNAADDYLICNIPQNRATCYNADPDDEGVMGYGVKPPFQNVAILKGPLADAGDGIDNNHDGNFDEANETIGISHFVSYNGVNNVPDGQPQTLDDFYQYLSGIWLDGLPVTYGDNGRNMSNPPCNYMFPGLSDPGFPGQPWTMATAGFAPDDRRFIMSAGKFTIAPGETRTIDFAYIYSRDTVGSWPSDAELKNAIDVDKVQWWFNHNQLSSCPPPASVYETTASAAISIYPVPSKNSLSISHNLKGKFHFTVYDITGKICINDYLRGNTIDISKLDAGSYQLKLFNDTEAYTAKFVKM